MKTLILIIAGCLIAGSVIAGKSVKENLNVISSQIQRTGDRLNIDFALDYSGLEVPSNEELIVRPLIVGTQDTMDLPVLLFPGKTREKVNQRKVRLYGQDGLPVQPYRTFYPDREENGIADYWQQVPFENWMYGARLELQQEVLGCADCRRLLASIPLNIIPERPRVAFIVPQPVSSQEENLVLYIHFPWDQAVILRDFADNENELMKIDRSIQKYTGDRSGQVEQIVLTGYASPEGTYAYNTRLAGRRAQAVKQYIQDKFQVADRHLRIDTVPEDWSGLRQRVDSSGLNYRERILGIIDGVQNPDARDRYLRQIDGNTTYRYLLRNFYPTLRRVDCNVSYKIAPLPLEESRVLLQEHPERLSLYEIYQVARSYPQGSPEFNDIVLLAVQLHPQNDVANNNAAAVALQNENRQEAESYLERVEDENLALNNWGILFLQEGQIEKAIECFEKAKSCGCQEAGYNLDHAVRLYSNN